MKSKNIESIVKKNLCSGCGICIAICPTNSIDVEMDYLQGIYAPKIDASKCKSCELCLSICPGKGVDFPKLCEDIFDYKKEPCLLGNYLCCYEGYSNDKDIRLNSSSGGLVTQTLIYALEKKIIDGALVTKMHKDKPITFIARTREEIIEASTSKYCPVSINMALKEIINSDNNEKFAVVGLPCHIQGIRNAMAKVKNLEKKIILCLGLFCAKGVSFLGSEYLFRKMNIDVKKIKNISYRGNGWPGKLSISMDEVSDPIEIEYPIIYEYFSFFQFWRCNFCPDASCELSDISFADAWLPRYMSADKIGRSIVVTRTDAGDKIIRSMANQGIIDLNSISYDDVLKSQDCFIWKKRDLIARQKIAEIFRRDVPKNCCNNMYTHLPLKSYPISLVSLVLREIALDRRLWPILDLFHKGRY